VGKQNPGAIIAHVEPGSPADALGLRPGDRLRRINGQEPRDVIDVVFYGAEEHVTLTVETAAGEEVLCELDKEPGESLGLTFSEELFQPLQTCNNDCLFCFVHQAPPNLRPTVYVRDDDYRLSFLHGNFTTLTNLTEAHCARIVEQRLSPLYVSVHTTNPDLRPRLFGNPKANRGLEYLYRLCDAGIQLHTQLVLCPGLNDGPELDRSVRDLAARWPQVRSISAVPVGLTKFQPHRNRLRVYEPDGAAQILDQIEAWQARFRREMDCNLVYVADEFYFLAGRPLPAAAEYDDFPQVENGVGLTRLFLDEAEEVLAEAPPALPAPRRVTVVTGALGGKALAGFVEGLNKIQSLRVDLAVVPNRFFGEGVTVAGLLTGQDILSALRGRSRPDLYLLPAVALNEEGLFLDDLRPEDLARELGVPVQPAARARDLAVWAWGR